jgi:pyruvate dehydrogenase E2 component (dihydrolipoamide acetyltransferase)
MNMTYGTLLHWLEGEGDEVQAGQPLFEVETEKAVQEVESPASGLLAKIVVPEGEEVSCLTVLAVITDPGEPLPASIPDRIAGGIEPKAEVSVQVQEETRQIERTRLDEPARIRISPVARRLAKELKVDVTKLVGKGGTINREDVQAAYQAQQAVAQYEVTPLKGVRRAIAERMTRSNQSVARAGLSLSAGAAELIGWRERLARDGHAVSYDELLVRLIALALEKYPYMNSQLAGDEIREMAHINVGVATHTDRGLLVPVVRDANKKDVIQIHHEFASLVERARNGRSTLEDLSDGTFTVSNLGMFEIEEFFPVVNVPECAILGVGTIVKRPVVIEDSVEVRPVVAVTLSFDHRLVDGAPAAQFLRHVKHLIENP